MITIKTNREENVKDFKITQCLRKIKKLNNVVLRRICLEEARGFVYYGRWTSIIVKADKIK